MASAYRRLPDLGLRFDCAFLAQRFGHHGCQIHCQLKTAKGGGSRRDLLLTPLVCAWEDFQDFSTH